MNQRMDIGTTPFTHSCTSDGVTPAFEAVRSLVAGHLAVATVEIRLTDAAWQDLCTTTGPTPTQIILPGTAAARVAAAGRTQHCRDLWADPSLGDPHLAAMGGRFWAATPLPATDGTALGVLEVSHPTPRDLTQAERTHLETCAEIIASQLRLARAGAGIDPVSRLPNRRCFFDDMDQLGRTHPGEPGLLALVDLARPDELARMLGIIGSHRIETLVREDAAALRSTLGDRAQIYHVGTTRFALLAPPGTDHSVFTALIANDLARGALRAQIMFSTTCTAGLAPVVFGEATGSELLRRAQSAVDDARRRAVPLGLYTAEQDTAYRRAFTILADLPAALVAPDQLRLAFQPRLELATGRCIGVEALLRWTHPELGDIPPGEFIPLTERTIMARPLTRWVLEAALARLAHWQRAGLDLNLSINISPANLQEPDFAGYVLHTLAQHGLPAAVLELEITESTLLAENAAALRQLTSLSDAGIRIAIDDFGTGYSSLAYLQRLPADVVKIDQSFIRALGETGASQARHRTLVTAMINLSHDLGYRVVAEGIETQDIADMLAGLGCDEVQGYHFGRPMPASAFLIWHAGQPHPGPRTAPEPGLDPELRGASPHSATAAAALACAGRTPRTAQNATT